MAGTYKYQKAYAKIEQMDGGDKQSSAKDPYLSVVDQARDSMRPEFLRNAESAATSQGSTKNLDAQSGEKDVSSEYTNNVGKGGSVQGEGEDNESKKPRKLKRAGGFFKKKGPLVSIIISLVLGGSGMYLSQAALPYTMLDKLNGLFDTTNTSTELRSKGLTKSMMKNARNATGNNITKKNIFGTERFKPTRKMKKKLAKQGITFEDSGHMIYKDKTGAITRLDVEGFKSKLETDNDFRSAYTNGTKSWRTSVAEFKDKLFDRLLSKFGLSKNRFSGYDAEDDADGSKARKQMAQDTDDATDFSTKVKEDGDKDSQVTRPAEVDENGNVTTPEQRTVTSGAGSSEDVNMRSDKNPIAISEKMSKSLKKVVGFTSIGCGITKALSAMSVILAAYQLAQVITVAQSIFEGVDKARTEDANSSPINAIGKSLTMKESEEKTRVDQNGNGYANFSILEGSMPWQDPDTGEAGEVEQYDVTSQDPTFHSETTKAKSAIQSEGLSSLYTGDDIDPKDESVMGFNPTAAANQAIKDSASSVIGAIPGGWFINKAIDLIEDISGLSVGSLTQFARKSYVFCLELETAIDMVEAAINVATGVSIILGFFTGGISAAIGAASKAAWSAAKAFLKAAIKAIVVSIIVSIGTELLMNLLMRKITTEFAGEDLGNAIYSGGSALMSSNHRAGGGVVASKEGYLASLIHNSNVEKETARNERLARSPFDYTSQYTFAGQLASAIIPITLQSDSVLDSVGNFSSVVRNSVTSFLPTANAASAAEKAEIAAIRTEENCPELHDIGGVADAFCNPYVTTDFNTMEIADDEEVDSVNNPNSAYNIVKRVQLYNPDNFKESDIDSVDNPEINLDSNLGKFVVYCGQRMSPFGQPDQNIVGEITSGQSTGNSYADAAIGASTVGDIFDIISNTKTLLNWGWVDGSNCVMDHSTDMGVINLGARRVSYDEVQAYSRYAEDQRIAESMGLVEKSAVSIALDEYYAEHPLDNSTEGILARMTGMTKDEVIATIDSVEVYAWLAQYDPTDMYPTPAVHKEMPNYTMEDRGFVKDDGLLAIMNKSFTDLFRQRNFATA